MQELSPTMTPPIPHRFPQTRRRRAVLLAFLAVVFLVALGASLPAAAQITRTARVELTDAAPKIHFGTDIYLTPDEGRRLTAQVIANRHLNNLGGTRRETHILNLGLAAPPTWMVFSVTNNSSTEDWVLHFGDLFDGRMSLASALTLKAHGTEEMFARGLALKPQDAAFARQIHGPALALTIQKGQTQLFILYLEPAGNFPKTLAPALMTQDSYITALRMGDALATIAWIGLLGAALLFVALAFLHESRNYLLFAGYYALHIVLIALMTCMFLTPFALAGALIAALFCCIVVCGIALTRGFLDIDAADPLENTMLLTLGGFVIAGAVFNVMLSGEKSVLGDLLIFVPAILSAGAMTVIAFTEAQKGKHAGHYAASAWAALLAGLLITGLTGANVLSGNVLFINAYWLGLLAQAAFLIAGSMKKQQMISAEKSNLMTRQSRAAITQARLEQSKESADQARLLRVIERERELMTELREREMQRTEDMRRAKEMADTANRAKSAFLAVVSHEIRTPMTGIMGMVRLLKETKLGQEQMDYLLAIQKSGDTMMALLNDILDFEKIETGNMELENIDFDLPKLVQGVVTLMSGHASDKRLALKADIPSNFPRYLKGDPTRLRQVLLNLVSNAIKFTDHGSVTIRLRATKLEYKPGSVRGDYEIYFAVEDTGVGISEDVQEHLFNPFEQGDKSITRKYGGTGLGLAICQRLIKAMGSTIRLTSEETAGSTFFFTLLMEKGRAEAAEEIESVSLRTTRTLIPPMRILVIEDNEINRKVLQSFLEKDGHQVMLSESGEKALEILQSHGFDAIFTDINLIGMNGVETAKTIRTLPDRKVAKLPIIAITANIGMDDKNIFAEAGINGFIGKPINYEKLQEALANIYHGRMEILKEDLSKETLYHDITADIPALPDAPPETYKDDYRAFESDLGGPPETTALHQYIQEMQTEAAPLKSSKQKARKARPAAADDPALLDKKTLQSLLKSLGKDKMDELLAGFTAKCDEIVNALGADPARDDLEFMRDRAHELKGMAANFGLKGLSQMAGRLEKAAQGKDTAAAQDLREALPAANRSAQDALRTWLTAVD